MIQVNNVNNCKSFDLMKEFEFTHFQKSGDLAENTFIKTKQIKRSIFYNYFSSKK